jgi:F0F1-type ATP synthase membrane subunit b/b'
MNYETIAQYSEVIGGFAFVVAMVVLFRKFLLPAVRSGEVARNADLVNTERRRDQLRQDVADARGEVESADRDALAILARAESDARQEHQAIVDEGRREASRLIVNARGELDRARIAGSDDLRIEFIEKALNRARDLAAQQLSDAGNARLVAKTVDDMTIGAGGP